MAIDPRALVIGLTAPFGSGSTTSAGLLASRMQFKSIKLSSFIRDDFERTYPQQKEPSRSDLQTHGDVMRKAKHRGILANWR
jgi:dephospho-CoA kinase